MKCKGFIFVVLLVLSPLKFVDAKSPEYTTCQNVQFALTTIKSVARLFANLQTNNLSGRKKAWLGRIIETLAHATNCVIEPGKDISSKITHSNAVLWKLLKHGEEFKRLKDVSVKLNSEEGCFSAVGLVNDDESIDMLSEFYYGYDTKDHANDDDEWASEFDDGAFKEIKKVIQFFLIAIEWGTSVSLIQQKNSKKQQIIIQIVRSVSDLLLRYLFNDGLYKSNSKIGYIEMVSSAVPHLWDVGKGVYDLYDEIKMEKEEYIRELIRHPMQLCVICQDHLRDGDDIAFIDCDKRHSFFHKNCIEEWLSRSSGNYWRGATKSCPICRKENRKIIIKKYNYKRPEGVVIPDDDQPVTPQAQVAAPVISKKVTCVNCKKECQNMRCGNERLCQATYYSQDSNFLNYFWMDDFIRCGEKHCGTCRYNKEVGEIEIDPCEMCKKSDEKIYQVIPCNHFCCKSCCFREILKKTNKECPECNGKVDYFLLKDIPRSYLFKKS